MKTKVNSTSFSRAQDFEKCGLFFKFRHLDKIPDPRPPLPDGKEYPNDRGSRIHRLAEAVVKNSALEIPPELVSHEHRIQLLRELYKRRLLHTEYKVAFDQHWQLSDPDDFKETRYRAILDVLAYIKPSILLIADWKSGKKQGNEIKHFDQCLEYGVAMALIDPQVQLFELRVWYTDTGEELKLSVPRSKLLRYFPKMQKRHEKVLIETIFEPRPSQHACFFCPYKCGMVGRGRHAYPGSGHCNKNVC